MSKNTFFFNITFVIEIFFYYSEIYPNPKWHYRHLLLVSPGHAGHVLLHLATTGHNCNILATAGHTWYLHVVKFTEKANAQPNLAFYWYFILAPSWTTVRVRMTKRQTIAVIVGQALPADQVFSKSKLYIVMGI